MVSSTKQTERRRKMRGKAQGQSRKRAEAKGSTPKFPVHPEGYDPKAPDAKSSSSSS
jgi:hypothetical protein